MNELRKRLIASLAMVILIVAFGTVGYMIVEDWNFFDSLYMTVITLTTVGYKEVHDLSFVGKLFTLVLIIGGVGTVFYILTTGAKFILEGEMREIFGRKRMEKKVKDLTDHYIICGYGRMGRIICSELKESKIKFVVIEKEPDLLAPKEDVLIFKGDATRDETLKEIGIERARGLVSVLPTDAENLFVVLSARGLNPKLLIVARAGEDGSERKLLRAGADRVVSPYHIGGIRIAQTILKPAVVDFIEFATKSGNIDLQMEEVVIQEGSELVGLTLDECGIGRDIGVIIVAIKEATGALSFNPTFRTTLKAGNTVIALGEISKLRKLEELARSKQK